MAPLLLAMQLCTIGRPTVVLHLSMTSLDCACAVIGNHEVVIAIKKRPYATALAAAERQAPNPIPLLQMENQNQGRLASDVLRVKLCNAVRFKSV
jgi:hypothetical protein